MGYLLANDFENRMALLAGLAPDICTLEPMAEPTNSQRDDLTNFSTPYSYLKITKGVGPPRRTVLIVAGQHAREWAQPDAALELAEELVSAYRGKRGIKIAAYTNRAKTLTSKGLKFRARDIKRIVEKLVVLIVPLANPDGRDYSQTSPGQFDKLWRKNRAPRQDPAKPLSAGVDLNRNHPFAWNYEDYYTPGFLPTVEIYTSRDAEDFAYRGPDVPPPNSSPPTTGPLSQPEVRNLHTILDTNPVTWCIDLHSKAGEIYYPWGTEANGIDATKTFLHGAHQNWDGPALTGYSEYLPGPLLARHQAVANSMAANVKLATGRTYAVMQSAGLYPAPGTLSDSFFSRQFPPTEGKNILSFETEFGFKETIDPDDGFQPVNNPGDPDKHKHGYEKIRREIWAVVMTFLLEAAKP